MKIKKRKKHWKEKNTGRREGGKEGRKKKDASNQGILLRRKKLARLKTKVTSGTEEKNTQQINKFIMNLIYVEELIEKNLHHSLLLIALYNLTNQPMITLQIWQPDLNAINPFIVLLLLLFHLRGKLQYLINDIYSHLCTPEA